MCDSAVKIAIVFAWIAPPIGRELIVLRPRLLIEAIVLGYVEL